MKIIKEYTIAPFKDSGDDSSVYLTEAQSQGMLNVLQSISRCYASVDNTHSFRRYLKYDNELTDDQYDIISTLSDWFYELLKYNNVDLDIG